MSENNSGKIPAAPPRQRPTPLGQSEVPMTDQEKEQRRQEIVQAAPLQTRTEEVIAAENSKPWRDGMNLPAEQLMQIRSKTSLNQPQEHVLRLAFLAAQRNKSRGFGPKIYVSDLINEAIEQYTKAELKKIGYDTK